MDMNDSMGMDGKLSCYWVYLQKNLALTNNNSTDLLTHMHIHVDLVTEPIVS